jgi:two-component system, OmpR family, sensor histidine kinase VicK
MTIKTDQQQNKCALCGKLVKEQQGDKSAIHTEVIDGTSYTFDKNECVLMFKRLRSVYGAEFENSLVPHEQFVSDPFWNRAIPTVQEIKDIEIEKKAAGEEERVLAKQNTIKLIEDPDEIQRTAVDIGTAAKDEVLIIFSTPNAFHRQERLGGIQALKEAVEKRSINARILTPKDESIENTVRTLMQQGKHAKIEMRYIEPSLQSQVTTLIVDRKSSLVVELKDDTKESIYEAIGLGIYSNRKATVLSYVSIFESLWKQTELHEQLETLYEQLKIHDQMQKEFINVAAHELRTPIQPIIGLAEILRSKKDMITTSRDVYDEYLSIIIRNARKLKELTDNILDVARIESQSMKLNKQKADIASLILQAIEESIENQTNIINHNVKLMYNPSRKNDESNTLLSVDKARIIQVITNLISNAIAFTKKGVISITKETRMEEDGSSVIVTLKDTGSGIDPQILPRLFTKFTTRSEKGTGLGLYICKRIIEAHGGKIWGGNNDGEGATFGFSLPIATIR